MGNRELSRSLFKGLMRWGFSSGREIEAWGDPSALRLRSGQAPLRTGGIRLLGEWGFFDRPEPRTRSFRWMAPLFRLFKPIRLFHFRLGTAQKDR